MIYLTLVVFFGFLLVIWVVVKLLFKLNRQDSFHFDRQHVWETHNINKKDMYPPGPPKT
ncbi:hypothetical protein ACAF76_015515 [Brevibacillus sp. TJ4]|uniref:hypothetical protein n=1 Tax=Brevibacillus sp. TJ4 TaxID=3234853 RepID=UPI0037D552FB